MYMREQVCYLCEQCECGLVSYCVSFLRVHSVMVTQSTFFFRFMKLLVLWLHAVCSVCFLSKPPLFDDSPGCPKKCESQTQPEGGVESKCYNWICFDFVLDLAQISTPICDKSRTIPLIICKSALVSSCKMST